MPCENNHIRALLPDHVTNHLNGSDRITVDVHLTECDECRDLYATMLILAQRGDAFSWTGETAHPSDMLLSRYYQNRDSLDAMLATALSEHIRSCRECSDHLAIMKELEEELTTSLPSDKSIRIQQGAQFDWLRHISARVRFVSIAVGLGVLLATSGIWYYQQHLGIDDTEQVYVLQEQRRSLGVTVEVRTAAGDETVRLVIPFPHSESTSEYGFAIRNRRGGVVSQSIRPDYSDPDQVMLELGIGGLANGSYSIVMSEVDRGDIADTTLHVYPFRLVVGQ